MKILTFSLNILNNIKRDTLIGNPSVKKAYLDYKREGKTIRGTLVCRTWTNYLYSAVVLPTPQPHKQNSKPSCFTDNVLI